MGKITVLSIKDYETVGHIILNDRGIEADGVVSYRLMNDKEHCAIYCVETDPGHEREKDKMIKYAFDDIISAGKIPLPLCSAAKKWYEKQKMLREESKQEEVKVAGR